MKPDKIIFLDVDGPLVPGTRYLHNARSSFERDFCPNCLMVLRHIVDKSGAQIVFNTFHNTEIDDLVAKITAAGFGDNIHPTRMTDFPYGIDEAKDGAEHGIEITTAGDRRLVAIKKWIKNHGTDNLLWIAIDDERINHKRALRVDFDAGMTLRTYNEAAKFLMFKPFLVW